MRRSSCMMYIMNDQRELLGAFHKGTTYAVGKACGLGRKDRLSTISLLVLPMFLYLTICRETRHLDWF